VILAIGTKLQAIIARMAVEITERHTVIQGMPVVKLSDEHFWFGKPQMVLHLIHFALFQVSKKPLLTRLNYGSAFRPGLCTSIML
jgi:mlo protein